MKIASNYPRHCHSERAERLEESNALDSDIGGKSPTPHPWIPAYAGMTVGRQYHFHPRMGAARGMGNSEGSEAE